jgi:prepilin-type processing-associated H-X9-DG protein
MEFGWWFAGAGWDSSGEGDVVLGSRSLRYAQNGVGCSNPANWVGLRAAQRPPVDCDQCHYWSFHANGANFLLGDGSVRFLTYNVSPVTLQAMSTKDQGEVFTMP